VNVSLPTPRKQEVLVKTYYVGINASDINFVAGRYQPGLKPPFDVGFEAVGKIVKVGEDVKAFKVGEAVVHTGFGAFSEYLLIPQQRLLKVPVASPQMLTLPVSGLTASLALEQVGQMGTRQTVLVTAAAGGTGQFAVQLAKLAGNHVIATCSQQDKVTLLKELGADRVINYRSESLKDVLKKEYPRGVDIVYESVGGEFFDICVQNLAIKGRLIVIGLISGYQDQSAWKQTESKRKVPLAAELLPKSASVCGFFLNHFSSHSERHFAHLTKLIQEGQLKTIVDGKKFVGLEQVGDAIEYLYSGNSVGKIVVELANDKIPSHL